MTSIVTYSLGIDKKQVECVLKTNNNGISTSGASTEKASNVLLLKPPQILHSPLQDLDLLSFIHDPACPLPQKSPVRPKQ